LSHRRKSGKGKKKKKRRNDSDYTARELTGTESYGELRAILFETAEEMKKIIEKEGVKVGKIKDCAPIFQFACTKCDSATVAVYVFSGMVALACTSCGIMEVVGNPHDAG